MPLKYLKRKIDNLLTRAVVDRIMQNDDKGKVICQVLGLADETLSNIEHLQQYGIRSIPLEGSRGVLIAYGGSKDNCSLINVDDKRYGKFTLQSGDVCIYSQNGAHTIYRGDDIIEILDGSKTITVDTMTAVVDSSGITVTNGDVVADGISLKDHTHTITGGSSAGTTSAPN